MPTDIKRRLDRLEGKEPRYLSLGELLDELDRDPTAITPDRTGRVPHPALISALERLPGS